MRRAGHLRLFLEFRRLNALQSIFLFDWRNVTDGCEIIAFTDRE
jgi:hypothetical protein